MLDAVANVAPAAAPQGPPLSVHDRLKAHLSAPEPTDAPETGGVAPSMQPSATSEPSPAPKVATEDKQVPDAAQAAEDQAEDSADEQSGDAQSEERQFSNLTELLEAGGFDLDKGLDLELPVKIDGKEGTARLRDLVKSYQLDGHINQRLEAVNSERQQLQAETQKFMGERADKLLKLDSSLKTAERVLMGEFAQVDWNSLAAQDPAGYNATFVQFQQRNALLQDAARQLSEEQAQHQAQQHAHFQAHLTEQKKLVDAKFPEWADASTRNKDKAEMASFLESEGAPKGTFEALTDAWQASVVRKALLWERLQKTKPGVLNKVKAAPKLLKPGTPQSRAAATVVASSKDRDQLRQSGRVRDAVPLLKRQLFG